MAVIRKANVSILEIVSKRNMVSSTSHHLGRSDIAAKNGDAQFLT
jgi:hypothetical protein